MTRFFRSDRSARSRPTSALAASVLAAAVCTLAAPGAAADAGRPRTIPGASAGPGSASASNPGTDTGTDTGPDSSAASGGDVEVHGESTAAGVRADEPRTCTFYLDAFGLGGGGQVRWTIGGQPPAGTAPMRSAVIPLDADGHGITENMRLPDGRYRLDWSAAGRPAGSEVFTVDCAAAARPAAPKAAAGGGAPAVQATRDAAPVRASVSLGDRLAPAGTGDLRWVAGAAAVLVLAGAGLTARRRSGRG